MIKIDKRVQEDFLSKEWCLKLLEAGIDMTDAKWFIGTIHKEEYIVYKDTEEYLRVFNPTPTCTLSELIYKLAPFLSHVAFTTDNCTPYIETAAKLLIQHCRQKSTLKLKQGVRVRWNDPGIDEYEPKDREAVLNRVFLVHSIQGSSDEDNDPMVYIVEEGGGSEAEVWAHELEIL